MMLCRLAFCLSGKVVALHLDNSTAKAYLCNQGGTVSPFLSRLACCILSLTDKHGITLLAVYIPTHLKCGGRLSVLGSGASGVASSPKVAQTAFHLWGPSRGGPAGIFSFHSMPALLHLGISTASGALGLNVLNHPWTFQVSYLLPPAALFPQVLSKFLVEHIKGQLRWLILVAPCWMEVPSLPTVLNMLADVPQQCQIMKDLVMDASIAHVLKGLPYLHLTLWLLSDVCYADKGYLPQSVRQWQGQLKHLHQRSTSSVGRNGQVVVLNRLYQTMPFLLLH